MIIGRGHLDHITANQIQAGETMQQSDAGDRVEATTDWRAGAGRTAGVEKIDVEGYVTLFPRYSLAVQNVQPVVNCQPSYCWENS